MNPLTSIPLYQPTVSSHPPSTNVGAVDIAVGNTPLIELRRVTATTPKVQVFAKAEWFNPGGSVKDRPALNILRTAIAEGKLPPGRRLLDSTSGNMGIAYATLGAALNVPITLAIPANASPERLAILRALGAELVLTDEREGTDGSIRRARQLASEYPKHYYYANQYDNPANWQAHYFNTGPEIVQQTTRKVTHLVAGLGTSGTLTGTGRYLKEYNPAIQLIAVQPNQAHHGLEGLKHMSSAIQPGIYDPLFPNRFIGIETEAAYTMTRRLAYEEGLFVGVSSGAAAATAIQIASELQEGVVVAIFPDAGYKYLSHKELWRQ